MPDTAEVEFIIRRRANFVDKGMTRYGLHKLVLHQRTEPSGELFLLLHVEVLVGKS